MLAKPKMIELAIPLLKMVVRPVAQTLIRPNLLPPTQLDDHKSNCLLSVINPALKFLVNTNSLALIAYSSFRSMATLLQAEASILVTLHLPMVRLLRCIANVITPSCLDSELY